MWLVDSNRWLQAIKTNLFLIFGLDDGLQTCQTFEADSTERLFFTVLGVKLKSLRDTAVYARTPEIHSLTRLSHSLFFSVDEHVRLFPRRNLRLVENERVQRNSRVKYGLFWRAWPGKPGNERRAANEKNIVFSRMSHRAYTAGYCLGAVPKKLINIYIYIRMYNKDVVRVVRFSIYFINTHSHARARARRLHYILLHSDGGSEQQQVDWNRSKSDSTPDGVSLAIVL